MQYTFALIPALMGVGALAAPQGVTDVISPTAAAPAECTGTFDGNFEITVAQATIEKRSIPQKRAECGAEGVLVLSLQDGTTLDGQGRTGYIASNYQFQFDGPAQAGAIYTSGFSVCPGNVLALGDSKTFYRCLSGDFYNLYDRDWAEQCEPVSIIAIPCGGAEDDVVPQIPDGQIVATTVIQTTIVTALPDGQPQVVTTEVPVPVCQISDGQPQAGTTPCVSLPPPAPTTSYIPVSESSDGQIGVTTSMSLPPAPPVTSEAPPSPPETTPAPAPTSESAPVTSSAPVETPSPSSSEAAPSPSAPVESPPPTAGSSRTAAGSIGALIVGFVVAYVCL